MKLAILSGPDQGKTFELAPGNNFIGRADENSIVLQSGQVSRRHACLSLIDTRLFLEDLGSSNGTYMNGQRIQSKVEVLPGVPFQVGEFIMQMGDPAAPSPGAPFMPPSGVPPSVRPTIPAPMVPPGQMPGRGRGPSGIPGQPFPIAVPAGRAGDTPFWRFYRKIQFLGWRGQVVLLAFVISLLLVGFGVSLPLQQSQKDLENEVVKRGEVLVKNLAMRNGEFIKNRLETNLDTASFLAEQGVSGAYLLSKELTVLSPVEQRGKSRVNDVSREALRKGLVTMSESQVQEGGDPGTYHIAMPIRVWSNELGNYETYGVAYLVFQAKQVAAANFGSEVKFMASTTVIGFCMLVFIALLFTLTNRPIKALHEDAELVLRGDLRNVESRARWQELVNLASSLNRSFDRYQQALLAKDGPPVPAPDGAAPSFLAPSGGSSNASGLDDAKVEAISNAVAEGVVITDDMQRVVYLNRMAERLFGVPLNRVKNRHIMEVIGNQDMLGAVLDLFKQVLNSEDSTVSASVPVSDGGTNRNVNLVVAGVKNSSRQLEYAAIVIR